VVINSSVFYNQLENLITATNVLNTVTGEWDIYSSNSGKLTTIGAELNLKWQVYNKLSLELSGTLQKTKDLRSGYSNILPGYSPQKLAYGKVLYNLSANTSISALFHYVGEMETEWITETTPEAGERLSKKSDGFFITDLNFRKDNILNKNLFLNLKINNLFNEKYFYPTTQSNSWIDKGVPGKTFGFLISAGIKF